MSEETIRGRVEADVSGYRRGMDEAARATDGFRRQAESGARGLTTLDAVLGGLGRSLPIVSGGVAGVALAAVGLARSAASTAAEIGRIADEVGISAEEMSRYRYAAKIAGVENDALKGGLVALQRAIEADSAALRAMGVETRDATGKARELLPVFAEVAEKFKGYASGAGEAALGTALFERDFSALQPLLERGAAGLRELTDEADTFGTVVDDEAADAARQFEEDLKRLQGALPGLAQELAGPVVKALGDVIEEFNAARRAGLSFLEMTSGVLLGGLADPTKSLQDKIAERRSEIEEIRGGSWASNSLMEVLNPEGSIGQLEKEIAYLENLVALQQRAAETAGARGEASTDAGRAAADAAAVALEAEKAAERERERAARERSRLAAAATREAQRAAEENLRKMASMDRFIEQIAEKELGAAEAVVKSLDAQARSLEDQIDLYGMTEAQIALVNARRAEERLEIAKQNGESPRLLAALEREVELRREIAGAAGTIEARKASAAAAEQAAQDWQRTADAIEDALIDALMEGGKSGAEYIEGLFRSMVLRPIVQALVQPIAGGITSAMGFGAPGAGGAGGSLLSMASNISSLSNLTNLGSLGSSIGMMGGSFGAGTTMTATQLGNLANAGLVSPGAAAAGWGAANLGPGFAAYGLGQKYGVLGGVAGGVGTSALVGGVGGLASGAGFGAGATGALAGLGPAGWATIAVGAILGSIMGNKKPSDKSSWATVDPTSGKVSDIGSMTGKKDPGADQRDQTAALAAAVGQFATQAGVESALRVMIGQRDGIRLEMTEGWQTPTGTASNGGGANLLNYGNDLQASFAAMLDDLVDEGTLPQETIDRWRSAKSNADATARDAGELIDVLALINQGLTDTEILRADLLQLEGESLAQAAARMESLSSALDPLSADEAWAKATRALSDEFSKLGSEVPRTSAEFGRLLTSLDVTTDAGQETYRAMMDLAPAFMSLASAVEEVFSSISQTTAASVRDIEMAMLDNAGKYAYLDGEIDRLLGEIQTAYDPGTIQALFEQANSKMMEAWRLLDIKSMSGDEQQRVQSSFIDRFYELEALAQARLSVAPVDDAAERQAASADKAAAALDAAADRLLAATSGLGAEAAAGIREAAGDLRAAASNIQVTVRVAGGSEVGYANT